MNNPITSLFNSATPDLDRLEQLAAQPEPRSRFIIAITPRSGSSYLCDRMRKTQRLGRPEEVLGRLSINNRLKNIPGRTADEYLRHAVRVKRTANDVAGLKASWFQFENFIAAMDDRAYLAGFKYIYLTRRDLVAQAVSLYKATASSVFHSDKQHDDAALNRLNALQYDYDAIQYWYAHIVAQEQGWQRFFYRHRIFPLCISYEDIEYDVLAVLKRIATYVAVQPQNIVLPDEPSVFKKIGDSRNGEWAWRFAQDLRTRTG